MGFGMPLCRLILLSYHAYFQEIEEKPKIAGYIGLCTIVPRLVMNTMIYFIAGYDASDVSSEQLMLYVSLISVVPFILMFFVRADGK